MENVAHSKKYDLETRTFQFAKNIRSFVKLLPKTIANAEDSKQVVRSSGSVGANYIEANEALSKKDFLMRIKICRKEAKESIHWLLLIDCGSKEVEQRAHMLAGEAKELMMIFGSIFRKST